jgi:hypothetical protein
MYGWLSPKKISFGIYSAIFNTIQHAPLAFQLKYEKMLDNAIVKKEIVNVQYAMFKDRINMSLRKKQIYGTQVVYSKALKQSVVFPLIDPINVEKRRDSIGFIKNTMKSYTLTWKIKWDVDDYIKQLSLLEKEFKIKNNKP